MIYDGDKFCSAHGVDHVRQMTMHAEEEMDDDELSIFDIERCILTGKITECQKDTVTKEWKYVVEGQSVSGDRVGTVAKLSLTGKLFIITVYLV